MPSPPAAWPTRPGIPAAAARPDRHPPGSALPSPTPTPPSPHPSEGREVHLALGPAFSGHPQAWEVTPFVGLRVSQVLSLVLVCSRVCVRTFEPLQTRTDFLKAATQF